jgi:hypothetical protein
MSRRKKVPSVPRFRVAWIGQNINYFFVKDFMDEDEAISFSNTVSDSIVLRHKASNPKGQSHQWEIVPLKNSRALAKDIQLRRLLSQKGYSNFSASEVGTTTTSEYRKSQKVRLIDVFVIAPILIYAGVRKETPNWLRGSLIAIGAATMYYNAKNYRVNKKNEL